MSASNRQALFEQAMKSINRDPRFKGETGDKMVTFMSEGPVKVPTVSSGSVVIDQALGGGLPKGRVIEIYGAEGSGKTSVALTAVGNIQREGGTALFIDAENALDPVYASALGVNIPDLAVAQPTTAEETLELIHATVNSRLCDIIVLDSVASIVPKNELESSADEVKIGELARLMSRELKKMLAPIRKSGTTVIFINQTRSKIGGWAPAGAVPQTTPGGTALKFYSSIRLEVRRGPQVTGEGKEPIGNCVRFTVKKNKLAPPFATGETVLTYAKGINVAAEIVQVGVDLGILAHPSPRSPKWIEVATGTEFAGSKSAAVRAIENDPELMERLKKALYKALEAKQAAALPQKPPVSLEDEEEA